VREQILEIDERALTVLRGCDGTRDLGGVVLAAHRAGAYRLGSEIEQLLVALHTRGLLAEGLALGPCRPSAHPERPLEPLPGFTLVCDGHGSCCATYGSIAFTAAEAERACRLVPDAMTGGRERMFLPLCGSVEAALTAVTLVDGRCPLLADDGRCRVELAAGHESKPLGCRRYPATFVDDGEAVRVSVGVDCPCVLASLGRLDGAPLCPAGVEREGQLEPGTPVARLPERIRLGPDAFATRGGLRAWSREVLDALAEGGRDPLASFWALADAVQHDGLDVVAARAALGQGEPPRAATLAIRLVALASRTRDRLESAAAWRSERDRTRRLARWLDQAAQGLLEPGRVEALLAAGPTEPEHERFYLRATVHGHHLVEEDQPLVGALRDRAVRLLFARAAGDEVRQGRAPAGSAADPAATCPLAAVETMMRAQGLRGYAAGLG
jgi:lysine-N-methylase